MFKLVTLYRRVEDDTQTDAFFTHTNVPLAERLPGLVRTEVSWIKGKPRGESRFHLMYTLYFASQQSCFAAMQSEAGRVLAAALMPWEEAKIISWFYAEDFAEDKKPS